MKDNVTQLGSDHIKKASIPDLIQRMEESDSTIVIHLIGGRWSLSHLKGNSTVWQLIGVLNIISTHFCNLANGVKS